MRKIENNEHSKNMTIEEFYKTGAWVIANQVLSAFGMGLELDFENDRLIPVHTKCRGYEYNVTEEGYKKIHQYLKENIDDICEEDNLPNDYIDNLKKD